MEGSGDRLIRLHIPALGRQIAFERCPELAEAFAAILRGWNLTAAESGDEPIGTVRRTPRGYGWASADTPAPERWRRNPPETVVEALCDLHFELIEWFLKAHPAHLCMHCAAVRIGSGLAVFPSPTKAGKSTLTLQLAAAGHRIFGDDVLPLEPERNDGFALGIVPRVRLPLPSGVRAGLDGFIKARKGPGDRDYRYIGLNAAELAPLGETAPVDALVLLERQASGAARAEPVSHGEMLKLIIRRNFADTPPAPDIFGRLHDMAGRATRLRLAYSDGAEAVRVLENEVAGDAATRMAAP